MDPQLIKLIIDLGLTDKEARVYMASLELGGETASKIGKYAGVDRVHTYYTLASLKEKGLITGVEKSGVKYFSSESPQKLFQLGEEAKKKLEANLLNFGSLLPEFLSRYHTGSIRKPRVKFYESRLGYLSVYNGILEDKPHEFALIINYQEFTKLIDKKFEKEWIEKRIKLGIKIRWLDFDSELMRLEREKKEMLREIKFLPKEFQCPGGVFIYNHKLIFLSTGEEFMAIVIENEEFARLGLMIFEMLWRFVGK